MDYGTEMADYDTTAAKPMLPEIPCVHCKKPCPLKFSQSGKWYYSCQKENCGVKNKGEGLGWYMEPQYQLPDGRWPVITKYPHVPADETNTGSAQKFFNFLKKMKESQGESSAGPYSATPAPASHAASYQPSSSSFQPPPAKRPCTDPQAPCTPQPSVLLARFTAIDEALAGHNAKLAEIDDSIKALQNMLKAFIVAAGTSSD